MWYRYRPILIAALLLVIAALTGCSKGKTLNREEARSDIRSAVSLTAESELFVEFVRGGHATRHYAEGHAAYLRDTVRRSVRELEEATPEAAIRNATRNCIQLLKRLDRELSGIRAALDNDTALASLGDRMKNIRKDLERAQSEL